MWLRAHAEITKPNDRVALPEHYPGQMGSSLVHRRHGHLRMRFASIHQKPGQTATKSEGRARDNEGTDVACLARHS